MCLITSQLRSQLITVISLVLVEQALEFLEVILLAGLGWIFPESGDLLRLWHLVVHPWNSRNDLFSPWGVCVCVMNLRAGESWVSGL